MKIKPTNLTGRRHARRATAAVEAALVLPLLIIVTFGAIDIAQYINLAQLVSNASREGGRVASRKRTASVSEVEAAVASFISEALPTMSDEEIASALTVVVRNGPTAVAGAALRDVDSGNQIVVNVAFDFSVVRWLSGPSYWNNDVQECNTYCRRE